MKVLAISDTHFKRSEEMLSFVEEVEDLFFKANLVVHAGDFVSEEVYSTLKKVCDKNGIDLLAVRGNCDELALKEVDVVKSIGAKHEPSMPDFADIYYLALELGVSVMVFGYIHSFALVSKRPLVFCPGCAKLRQYAFVDKKLTFFHGGERVESYNI